MAAAERVATALGPLRGVRHLQHAIRLVVGQPRRWWERRQGREDFDFPGTWRITTAIKTRPDILHCHNLHGGWLRDGGYSTSPLCRPSAGCFHSS